MKKKWTIIGFIVLAIILGAALLAWNWLKPYSLPEIDEQKSMVDYRLDFAKENEVMKKLTEYRPVGSERIQDITAENIHLAYAHATELFSGTQQEQEQAIQYLLQAIELDPEQFVYSNQLRVSMASVSRTSDFISIIEGMDNRSPELNLQLALAYVDELQNPDIGIAVLGQTSSKSIEILNEIIEQHPDYWLAYYARGLNNLYWPAGLLRTDKAVQDLGYCLAVVQHLEKDYELPLWALAYEAYGDALVKNGEIEAGMKVWNEGARKYPEAQKLQLRANVKSEEAYEIVRAERGIEIFERPDPTISDLSILWISKK